MNGNWMDEFWMEVKCSLLKGGYENVCEESELRGSDKKLFTMWWKLEILS